MEVKILAKIDNKSYFEFVASTIQSTIDISDSEDKTLKKGLTYDKIVQTGFSKREISTVKVLQYTHPRVLELEYKTQKLRSVIKYVILPKSKDTCEVTYTEIHYLPNNQIKKLGTFKEMSAKKRIEKRMIGVVDYLKKQAVK